MRPEEPLFFANAERIFQFVQQRASASAAKVVVLSLEVSDDLDSTAVEALGEFITAQSLQGIVVLLARVKDRPRDALLRAGVGAAAQGRVPLYWSVDDAVSAATTNQHA